MRFSVPTRFLLLLPLTLALAACDSDKDDGLGALTGQSNVQVTNAGPANTSFSGGAHFTYLKEMNLFSLVTYPGSLIDQTEMAEMVTIHGTAGLPGKGAYSFEREEYTALYTKRTQAGSEAVVIGAETGTLTITSSSAKRIEGSFTFTGGMAGVTGQARGTVTGTFKAPSLGPGGFGRMTISDIQVTPAD